jgi:penicillin-binding protein 1A
MGCSRAIFFLFASWGLLGLMPSFEDLENPDSNLATEVISSDGVVIGKYFQKKQISAKVFRFTTKSCTSIS